MEIEKKELNKNISSKESNKVWLKPVLIFYIKTTSWIIFPLVLGLLAGKYVGKSFGSQSLFFAFIMAGFGITCSGIYKEIKKYKKSLDK